MSVTLIKRFTFKIIFIFSIFEKLGFFCLKDAIWKGWLLCKLNRTFFPHSKTTFERFSLSSGLL